MSNPISSIELRNFKGFRHYGVQLRTTNFLVGSNNCGKSTIISGFRILETALRKARSRNPERILVSGEVRRGYEITLDELDISTENVHTDYADVESSISFRLSNGNTLRIVFPASGKCYLIPEMERGMVASPSGFEKAFPLPLVVVPVLGPLEHDEALVKSGTVQRNLSSSRASRNFRTYWLYRKEEFAGFADLVKNTWPGMAVCQPELDGEVVQMYCLENRMTRELYWSGFGFQIWCQLLSHISRAEEGTLVVIDEPEIYLHPDLQRQIPRILDSLKLSSVIATHSTEIIGQAEPYEVIPVDKNSRTAKRLRELKEIQLVLEEIGSVQNLLLSRLARHGRILFFEGKDIKLLKRFAKHADIDISDSENHVSVIEGGGFQSWKKIRDLAWGLKKLNLQMRIGAILDRDYFTSSELKEVEESLAAEIDFVHIFTRKEIENYLLDPETLQCALYTEMRRKDERTSMLSLDVIRTILLEITEEFRHATLGQYIAKAITAEKSSGKDPAVISSEISVEFDKKWKDLTTRLAIVPGKEILRRFRNRMQQEFGVSLTDATIVRAFRRDAVPVELISLLQQVAEFTQLPKTQN